MSSPFIRSALPDLRKINHTEKTFQSETKVCGLDFVCRQRYFINICETAPTRLLL